MLHEFAVDPASLHSLEALCRVADQCGIHLGRYISDFPERRWVIKVRQHTMPRTFLGVQRLSDVLVSLERRGGLIATERSYDSQCGWFDNALREHAHRKFRAVISEADAQGHDFVLSVDALDIDMPPWNVETAPIPRTAEAIVGCVTPLFRLSREEILLVDPFFEPDTFRYRQTLHALLLAAHANGKSYDRLEYHVKVRVDEQKSEVDKRNWSAGFVDRCRDLLPKHIPTGVRLKVILWRAAHDSMHARYIMTERGAIRIDRGLDIGKPGETTDISLVPRTQYQQRRSELQPESRAFLRDRELTIVGLGK